MAKRERGDVWLGACGLVVNASGDWLVVQKRYSGLNGKWSFPAGFVQGNETLDEAAIREVKEETGITAVIDGLIAFRTGVLHGEVSDNMGIFSMHPAREGEAIRAQQSELYDARWMAPTALREDPDASLLVREFAHSALESHFAAIDGLNPGGQFGYTSYRLFFHER